MPYRHSFNKILIGTYTRSTQQCHFEWPWMFSIDLAKCLMTRSLARSLCDSWASCIDYCNARPVRLVVDVAQNTVEHWTLIPYPKFQGHAIIWHWISETIWDKIHGYSQAESLVRNVDKYGTIPVICLRALLKQSSICTTRRHCVSLHCPTCSCSFYGKRLVCLLYRLNYCVILCRTEFRMLAIRSWSSRSEWSSS